MMTKASATPMQSATPSLRGARGHAECRRARKLPHLPRGISTIKDLYARSRVDTLTGCWHWLGAISRDGVPRIHTVDYETGEKKSLSGPKAVWGIAHCCAPRPGWLVYRSCQVRDCVNPVHMAQARDKAEIGQHIRRAGTRVGTAIESRRENVKHALAARGVVATPGRLVSAIRLARPEETNRSLARRLGLSESVVSRLRLYQTQRPA